MFERLERSRFNASRVEPNSDENDWFMNNKSLNRQTIDTRKREIFLIIQMNDMEFSFSLIK